MIRNAHVKKVADKQRMVAAIMGSDRFGGQTCRRVTQVACTGREASYVGECQSASNVDPLSARNIDPSGAELARGGVVSN
jgi:hypothetical protein